MVKEHPILMNGAMVRAVLDGIKMQTRRIAKLQRLAVSYFVGGAAGVEFDGFRIPRDGGAAPARFSAEAVGGGACTSEEIHCPYGKPGDRLWVRETFGYVSPDEHQPPLSECRIEYRADLPAGSANRPGGWLATECAGDLARPRWRPSIHMPRVVSRILLEIVSVRVERLNDCSVADARAEGTPGGHDVIPSYNYHATPSEHFSHLWESINGAGSWAANPWVWVIEFKRVAT